MPHIKAPSGITWFYDKDGQGETLVFIHGWGVDRRIWRQQYKYFADHYCVVSIDLPGHGNSDWTQVNLETMARDLKHILKELGVHHLTLIGSSLGGLLILKYHEHYPQDIKRLVFVGSMPKFAKDQGHPHGLDIARMRKLHGQLETAYPNIVNIFFRSLFTKQERESRRFKWLQKFRQKEDVPIKPALASYLDVIEKEDLRHVLKTVQCPVQFLNGTHDEICTKEAIKALEHMAPHAAFDYFEECGHFPFLSKPHEFNDVLQQFLKRTEHGS